MKIDEKIKREIIDLYNYGVDLFNLKKYEQPEHSSKYQFWYTRAFILIKQLLPDRLDEFASLYKNEKRDTKKINALTYTISDYLLGLELSNGIGNPLFNNLAVYKSKFSQQISILNSLIDSIDSLLLDIKGVLQIELFDSEIDAAKELYKAGHLRAAGTLAGVTLEKHLSNITVNHEIKLIKKDPTISDFNEKLKSESIIDIPNWRFIQLLGDIRNLCAHNKEREPTKEEVNDLIIGVEKVTKTIF